MGCMCIIGKVNKLHGDTVTLYTRISKRNFKNGHLTAHGLVLKFLWCTQVSIIQLSVINSFQCIKSAEEKNSKYNYVDESDLRESSVKESTAVDSD